MSTLCYESRIQRRPNPPLEFNAEGPEALLGHQYLHFLTCGCYDLPALAGDGTAATYSIREECPRKMCWGNDIFQTLATYDPSPVLLVLPPTARPKQLRLRHREKRD